MRPSSPAGQSRETESLKMDMYIHRETSFKKSLEALSKGDKTASQAALRAEEIIARLSSGDLQGMEILNRRTKNGELRVTGCRKYSLGGGYRLICVKRENHLIATYVGSHDDCDRWLENNRGFEPELQLSSDVPCPSEEGKSDHPYKWEPPESEPDYDDILMEQIDEKILRRIFVGICGQP